MFILISEKTFETSLKKFCENVLRTKIRENYAERNDQMLVTANILCIDYSHTYSLILRSIVDATENFRSLKIRGKSPSFILYNLIDYQVYFI